MITIKDFDEFVNSLKQKDFYNAHEVLEKIWYPNRFKNSNEIKLLKGFINAAVSFELIKRGRKNQSKTPWKTYLKYRQLLFKLNSKQQNIYYLISLEIEKSKKDFN
ncbi:DUF309 domain-containing protein [Sulfurimonas lithotrophica]|uniref:DUF309 domain-containing protein n=1 Tax=Sulfurimonas lithotrophica TaxID=2590022 RepID=A0A5P8NXX2_9BACT|nr:DUF309 domain-containing protein [Sulfurimonas lithotrophica]QFR48285.1 DUF309 domain-containing protein [Sulfurimonas lithotrophica]